MEHIPTGPTLMYERNEINQLVVRDIWFERGKFYLDGVEEELMCTKMNTNAPFDKVIVRLEQELKQACLYIPIEELAIPVFEAYLTLPHDVQEIVGQPISNEVVDRMVHRLEHLELDILSSNRVAPMQVRGHGDSLDFMKIISNIMLLVHSKLYKLRQEGYYLGCVESDALDILLVRPYN